MWRSKSGSDISWLALACALAAMFIAIAVYRGIPSFADGGREAVMRLITYFGTFLAAMFLATLAVAVMFSLNATRRAEYKTPRRDFVLASLVALFVVLAGMAKS